MQRGALKGVQLGVGIRKGFLEEEVCKLDQDGWGEGWRGQKKIGGYGHPTPETKRHISKAATPRHIWAERTRCLYLGAQVFGSMVAELEGSGSTMPLFWAHYCWG